LKEGHKAADLGILVRRFSNENEGDRRLEQNKYMNNTNLTSKHKRSFLRRKCTSYNWN
jgi:hypothetical protein